MFMLIAELQSMYAICIACELLNIIALPSVMPARTPKSTGDHVCVPSLQVLLEHFMVQTPERPLYEANPADALSLHIPHTERAAKPLLRAFTQAVYAYTGANLRSNLVPKATYDLKAPYISDQIRCCVTARTVAIAMEVAALIGDHMLLEEGAIRAFHVLTPLLGGVQLSEMVHKAIASIGMALQVCL